MDLYWTIFEGNPWHYPISSLSNGAPKSAFRISMATDSEFFNFGSATTLSDPNRSTMPNFVEIGCETAEEIAAIAG